MHNKEICRNGCTYARDKAHIWQIIAENRNGCCLSKLVDWSGLSLERVESVVEDLYVEDKVYCDQKSGKWYPENLPSR